MSVLGDIYAKQADVVMGQLLGQTVTRRIGGNKTNTQSVTATIVEKDIGALSTAAGESGLVVDERGVKMVRRARMELLVTQTAEDHDEWVIDGEVWEQEGTEHGRDEARKTILLKMNVGQTGRRPRTLRS